MVVGGLIALAFMAVWIYLAIRRRRKARTNELRSSAEQINISPEGGWRPPLDDGDDDDLHHHMSAQYTGVLTQRPTHVINPERNSEGEGEGSDGLSSADIATTRAHSTVSVVPSTHGHHPYMTGFGQAAETMRDVDSPTGPGMIAADSAPVTSHGRRSSGGPVPTFWLAGDGRTPSITSSSHAHSSTALGREYGSKNASYDDDLFVKDPVHSSSQLLASPSFDVGPSSGQQRPMELTQQTIKRNPTLPESRSHRKLASTGSDHSLKAILGRLRSRSSPTPDSTPYDSMSVRTSASLSRHPTFIQPRPTSPSTYGSMSGAYGPSPPSSLLRPQLSHALSYNHQSIVNDEPSWPGSGPLTLPPLPRASPAESEDSHGETPVGLLDPRLEQTRAHSTSSFRDDRDYSRPIRGVRAFHVEYLLTLTLCLPGGSQT